MKSGRKLHKAARQPAEEMPQATLAHPFGPDYDVYEVAGKVFLLITRIPKDSTGHGVTKETRGKRVVVVKADPIDGEHLREKYETITPGYHMNQEHWITVANDSDIKKKLIKRLVKESYQLVVDTLPKADRPTA